MSIPRCYLLTDAKVGHNLATQVMLRIGEICPEIEIIRRTFYRMRVVENKTDPWIAIIRHPYEIITSSYKYHKICDEAWTTTRGIHIFDKVIPYAKELFPEADFSKGMPHRDILNSLSTSTGISYEMTTVASFIIYGIYRWPYHDYPNVNHVKYEDFYDNFDGTVEKIARLLDVDDDKIPDIIAATQQHNLRIQSHAAIMKNDHVTNKNLVRHVYKCLWEKCHYELAKSIFPDDLLAKFGYEI